MSTFMIDFEIVGCLIQKDVSINSCIDSRTDVRCLNNNNYIDSRTAVFAQRARRYTSLLTISFIFLSHY